MNIPTELKYTKDHEWVRLDGNLAYIGITDYAQHALGDVVFVELPAAGDRLTSGQPFGVVESVKAASDIYAPLSGLVKEVNNDLLDNPEKINKNPYDSWMVVIEPSEVSEELLDGSEYKKLCDEED